MGISIGRRPRTCRVAADISMSRRKDLGEMEVRTGEVGNVGLKMVWFMKPGLPGCYSRLQNRLHLFTAGAKFHCATFTREAYGWD
jgi:hypothetical protein